ncbi:MAG: GWxTD domain-containing protein [bacterium]
MLSFRFLFVSLFILVLGTNLLAQIADEDRNDFYSHGLEQKRSGNWAEALKTWLTGSQHLQRQGKSDPRIGIAFIQLVTEKVALKYYKLANEMYLWGFSQNNLNQFREDIDQEIQRISPLLSKRQYQAWRSLLEQGDSSLYEQIKSFWHGKDPTPSTRYNERLLEHWERIAYARKNFTKAKNTVYRTDDRGLFYVKYGMPGKIYTGTLGTNRMQFKRWTNILVDNDLVTSPDMTLVLQSIDQYNNFPEYEVWLYYSLGSEAPLIYIFGRKEGLGRFGLRNGVEDFIPDRAFLRTTTTTRYTAGLLPGTVLQAAYYRELMHLDSFFEDRFYNLESIWNTLQHGGPSALKRINNTLRTNREQFKVLDRFNAARTFAPLDKSDISDHFSPVVLQYHKFRFLDENESPKLAIFAVSLPEIKKYLLGQNLQARFHGFTTIHTLISYDQNQEEINRLTETLATREINASTFIFAHDKKQNHYAFVAEVYNSEANYVQNTQLIQPHISQQVIGLGRAGIASTVPLSTSPQRLELSDLLVGTQLSEDLAPDRLPLPVLPRHKMKATDLLKIYLEIYHLRFDEDGMAHFNIAYEISKYVGRKRSKKGSITFSYDFDAPRKTSKENFDIDISKLKPGHYQLSVSVTDKISGQTETRSSAFDVVDPVKTAKF